MLRTPSKSPFLNGFGLFLYLKFTRLLIMQISNCAIIKSIAYPNNKDKNMPENITGWIASIENSPRIIGMAMAGIMAVLSILYDKKRYSFVRKVVEAITCVVLAYMAVDVVYIMELDARWTGTIGGLLGMYGRDAIKALGLAFLRSKIPPPKNRRKRDSQQGDEENHY